MAATSVTNVRTVFLNVLLRILAVLGLRTPRRPAVPVTTPAPCSGSGSPGRGACAAPAFVPAQRRPAVPRSPLPRERSLPPTIKQRIRAEAHGSSPSPRRVACPGEDDLTALLTT